jgi:hypothetical protein
MSEHSLDELERQYQSAKEKTRLANLAEREAKSRLDQAKLTATGLEGHKVSYTNKRTGQVSFVVKNLGRFGDGLMGPALKKDGTLGQRDIQYSKHWDGDLTDHGLYVEPTP